MKNRLGNSCVIENQDSSQTLLCYRSAENKMDSSNLSVIFAPNLFHWGNGTEKMNASTEKRLKLQATVVQCLIENAQDLGIFFITTD